MNSENVMKNERLMFRDHTSKTNSPPIEAFVAQMLLTRVYYFVNVESESNIKLIYVLF